jgi:hypothetical protein
MKPCHHRVAQDGCRVCWLYDHDPAYRALWDRQTLPAPRIALPCLFLGPVVAEGHCPCPGQRVHACSLHGPVTINTHCKECPDYLSGQE